MPLHFFKEEVSYEVDVLHADKHGNLLQVDGIIFDGFGHLGNCLCDISLLLFQVT